MSQHFPRYYHLRVMESERLMVTQDIKIAACDSVFDVAVWITDRALEDGEYLQPQKMQRLLYLSQAYYGALSRGQKLIPCIFVANPWGPLNPQVGAFLRMSDHIFCPVPFLTRSNTSSTAYGDGLGHTVQTI